MTVCSLTLARIMPLAWGRAGGVLLARLALRLRPRERRLALANLELAFPGIDDRGRARLLAASVHALGRNFHDMLAIEKLVGDDRRIREQGQRCGGPPDLTAVMAGLLGRGRGLLLLTGHFGCWELLGAWVSRRLRAAGLGEMAVVTGTVHNPAVDRLLQARRRKLGLTVLPREAGPGPLVAHLRRGGVAAVLLDQNIRTQTLPVPFCGSPAPTADGPARIALRLGVPVLPVALGWDRSEGAHLVGALPVLDPLSGGRLPGDPSDAEVADFLAACNSALETFLRRNPAEWVWFHDRWGLANDSGKDALP